MKFCRIHIILQIISYINKQQQVKNTRTHILCAGMCVSCETLHNQLQVKNTRTHILCAGMCVSCETLHNQLRDNENNN